MADHMNPLREFPAFYSNPVVRALSREPRWTVSGRKDPDSSTSKMPIDMRELLDNNRVRGAYEVSPACLVDLEELTRRLPDAANCAFHLSAATDGVAVLDIEPDCPPEVSAPLLAMGGDLYRELSMSGRGHHLVMPLPANFWSFPVAASKLKLREEHGGWEVLLDHWVTFTRVPSPRPAPGAAPAVWEDVYASVASAAVEAPAASLDVDAEMPDVPYAEQILAEVTRLPHRRRKEDFHGDMSRFEFAVMGVLYNRLLDYLQVMRMAFPALSYSDSDRVWLLYAASSRVLEHRDKHDEVRNGLPLLLNSATALVARRTAEANQRQEN